MIVKTVAGDSIRTFTGKLFYPFNPKARDIDIEDIAHALSNSCRFTGHCRRFYSVAEHCYHVSKLCSKEDALWGLLHDASEAYIADIASPVKKNKKFEYYRVLENNLMNEVSVKFNLGIEPPSVKIADRLMLAVEMENLMPQSDWKRQLASVSDNIALPTVRLETWLPSRARDMFLYRFKELTNG